MQHNKKTAPARAAVLIARKNLSRNQPDYKAINRVALGALPTLLFHLLQDGKCVGGEWVARNPRRVDRRAGSFSVNLTTGKWADFATGDRGGDVISLVAYLSGTNQSEAARRLAGILDMGVR